VLTNQDNPKIKHFSLTKDFNFRQRHDNSHSVRQTYISNDNIVYTISWDATARSYGLPGFTPKQTYVDPVKETGYICSICVDRKNKYLFTGAYLSPASKKSSLRVFDIESTALVKKHIFESKFNASFEIANWHDKIVFGSGAGVLGIIDPSVSLEIEHSIDVCQDNGIRRMVMDEENDMVYLSDEKAHVFSVNLLSAEIRSFKVTDSTVVSIELFNDIIVAGTSSGILFRLSKELKLIDQLNAGKGFLWDIKKLNDMVVVASGDGNLRAFNENGNRVFSMLNFEKGFLFFQNTLRNHPWFYTDQCELISVARLNRKGEIIEILEINDQARIDHIEFYNDKRMIKNIILGNQDFMKTEQLLRLENAREETMEKNKILKMLR